MSGEAIIIVFLLCIWILGIYESNKPKPIPVHEDYFTGAPDIQYRTFEERRMDVEKAFYQRMRDLERDFYLSRSDIIQHYITEMALVDDLEAE